MSGIGGKHQEWTKELDEQLLLGVSEGKRLLSISVSMKMSTTTLRKRLQEMGFDGILDARKVMTA